jgi:hypothetical protein
LSITSGKVRKTRPGRMNHESELPVLRLQKRLIAAAQKKAARADGTRAVVSETVPVSIKKAASNQL